MLNLKIYQLINNITELCKTAIHEGVPVYAVSLALKDIEQNGVAPLVNQAVKGEYEEESRTARPMEKPEGSER